MIRGLDVSGCGPLRVGSGLGGMGLYLDRREDVAGTAKKIVNRERESGKHDS